jgi:hypothetical protein
MKIDKNLLYEYLDIIIIEAEIAEADNSKNILYEKHLNPISNEERDEYFEICEKVVSLGVKLGYMRHISKEYDWFELTKKGISAKEKGGYFKYIDFIEKKELERIKPTIIAENYIGGNNHGTQSLNNFSNSPITNNTIANPNNDRKANSIMLKFWKLISENKLISSLLLVIILWAMKEIFDINLKV